MSGLFLDDEPPPTRRGRPRWVDGLGLAIVVGAMVAIGILGDRGSKDERSAPTTTTSTATTTTSSSRLPEPTSTTPTTVLFEPLPERTGTRLVVLHARTSTPVVIDVDTGRSLVVPSAATASSGIGTTAGLLTIRNGQLSLTRLSPDLSRTETGSRPLGPREWLLTPVGRDGAWVTAQEGVDVVTGLVGPDGADTGKLLRLRPGSFVVAGFVDGVVAAQGGSLTWVPVAGGPRSLGTGSVFGYADGRIVRNTCRLLHCALEVVEVHTGATRLVLDVPEVQAEARPIGGRAVGADGTWLVTSGFDADDGYALLLAVDLRTGRGRVLRRGSAGQVAAAVEGPWVFQVDDVSHQVRAIDHRTGQTRTLRDIDDSDVTDLVALALP